MGVVAGYTTQVRSNADVIDTADAAHMPRIHHQWFPDQLMLEAGYSPDTVRMLETRGHKVIDAQSLYTSLQTVAFKDGLYRGAADPRRPDSAAAAPAEINAVGD